MARVYTETRSLIEPHEPAFPTNRLWATGTDYFDATLSASPFRLPSMILPIIIFIMTKSQSIAGAWRIECEWRVCC